MDLGPVIAPESIQLKRKPKLPVGVRFDDLPKEFQEVLNGSSVSEIVEGDPIVKEGLEKFITIGEDQVEIVPQIKPEGAGGGTLGVSHDLIEKRNMKIIDWYTMGISFRTILYNVNEASKKFGRGIIESEKTIRRIIAEYYTSIRPSTEELNVFDDAMREAAYAAHEQAIEKLSRVVINKPQSQRKSDFEYAIVLEKIVQARQLQIENRGWNKTRANPIAQIQNNTQINIINQNVDMYANKSKTDEKVQTLISRLDKILSE